ncbi:CBM35 domain-containing protein [Streptomyces umbrinus]|uniref:CBM35 domain-containing protein n=1 Tax=Streptomyces umbrinus TaxID=67370 RepID=UPI003F4D2E8C
MAAAVLIGAGRNSVGDQKVQRFSTVRSGDARFQVLSPTLIRTEYAGDGSFLDAATFNAIGRDGFARTPYTSRTSDGWLTLRTSAMTLKYKVGSGPFNSKNLSVELKAGDRRVIATPWRRATCAADTLCEAEDMAYNGLATASDHSGYTGTGFLAGFENTGDALTVDTSVETTGRYRFAVRYANGVAGDSQHKRRTLTLSIDGTDRTLSLPTTSDWDSWAQAASSVQLDAGRHTISLKRATGDSGNVNIDSLALLQPNSAGSEHRW